MPQQEAGRKRKTAVFQPLEGDLLGLLWTCVYAVDEDGRSFKGEDTIAVFKIITLRDHLKYYFKNMLTMEKS